MITLALAQVLADASKITAPFDLDAYAVEDAFLRNYLDLIAFLLQAAYMNEWMDEWITHY